MSTKAQWITGILIIILLILGTLYVNNNSANDSGPIRIGVITDLTGSAVYWGESTRVGAMLAVKELKEEDVNVILVFEDYQLDAIKAVTAAQKLVNLDNVDALYADFNPAAIAVGSFLKDKKIFFLYGAAVVSPLEDSPYFYKTYLDYQVGCRDLAEKFKDEGVKKIGVLKANLEFGILCLNGIREVFGEETIDEGFNLGDTDFRTQLLKLKAGNAGAIINVGFENDVFNTLKIMRELKFNLPYGTVEDSLTDKVKNNFTDELRGSWSFGFKNVSENFSEKLSKFSSQKLSSEYAAALAYTHIKQIANALANCERNYDCIVNKMNSSRPDETIGFVKFENQIGVFELQLRKH